MSRVGRMPVVIPDKVEIEINGRFVRVKGPLGELERTFHRDVSINREDDVLTIERKSNLPKVRSLHGLSRSLLNNMVVGVSEGFEKKLEVHGVGYRPSLQGETLVLNVGYSSPVEIKPPEGISFDVDERAREIRVHGPDKELVGQVAADVRKVRPPEPYKGKGIRYQGEHVRRKAGKAGKVGEA
ncbi:MAG: 50S ribosomal protein L6 [Anaerolineales bacterium]